MRLAPALVLSLIGCSAEPDEAPDSPAPHVTERVAMAVRFRVSILPHPGADEESEGLAGRALEEVERLEALLNPWDEGSELSLWNAASRAARGRGDETVIEPLHEDAARLVDSARAFAERSGGAFDPTVGALLRALGFYGDAVRPDLDVGERVGWRALEVVPGPTWRVRARPAGVELDLSGAAKGLAVERAADVLRAGGVRTAAVSAGGSSVLAFGAGPGGDGWPFVLPHPDGDVTWWLLDEAAATSGRTSIELPGGDPGRGHLVDPRSLEPVEHRTEMVAVRGPDAVLCDMAATAFCVLGREATSTWLARHPEFASEHEVVTLCRPEREGAAPEIDRLVLDGPAERARRVPIR